MDADLLPMNKTYSVIHLDRDRPPSDPDAATKQGEFDDLDEIPIPPSHLGITVSAYDEDGEAVELTEDAGFPEARDRIKSVMKDLKEET